MKPKTKGILFLSLAAAALLGGVANGSLFNFDNIGEAVGFWAAAIVLAVLGFVNLGKKD